MFFAEYRQGTGVLFQMDYIVLGQPMVSDFTNTSWIINAIAIKKQMTYSNSFSLHKLLLITLLLVSTISFYGQSAGFMGLTRSVDKRGQADRDLNIMMQMLEMKKQNQAEELRAQEIVLSYYHDLSDDIRNNRLRLTHEEYSDLNTFQNNLWNEIEKMIRVYGSYSKFLNNNLKSLKSYRKRVSDRLYDSMYDNDDSDDVVNSKNLNSYYSPSKKPTPTPVKKREIEDVDISNYNNTSKKIDYSVKIKELLNAEEKRDFESIYTFYSYEVKDYWSIKNPSKEELKKQYEKSWRITSETKNEIRSLVRLDKYTYYLNTDFSYYNINKEEWFEVNSTVRIVFNDVGYIVEINGVD